MTGWRVAAGAAAGGIVNAALVTFLHTRAWPPLIWFAVLLVGDAVVDLLVTSYLSFRGVPFGLLVLTLYLARLVTGSFTIVLSGGSLLLPLISWATFGLAITGTALNFAAPALPVITMVVVAWIGLRLGRHVSRLAPA